MTPPRTPAVTGMRLVILVLVASLAAPFLLDAVLFGVYASRYDGMCSAHATDIPARPCTYGEYLADCLGSAFGVMAIVMIDVVVAGITGVVAAIVALGVWAGTRRDAPRA